MSADRIPSPSSSARPAPAYSTPDASPEERAKFTQWREETSSADGDLRAIKVLVIGSDEEPGAALMQSPPELAHVIGVRGAQINLHDPHTIAAFLNGQDVDVVVNTACHPEAGALDLDDGLAHVINVAAPDAMARACAERGVAFIHVSRDYVFDGAAYAPRRRNEPGGRLEVFGRTRVEGETRVLAAGGCAVVLRTSWVFSAAEGNFLQKLLQQARERQHLRLVCGQSGRPTPAQELASAIVSVGRRLVSGRLAGGVYTLAGSPEVTWADFARTVFAEAGLDIRVDDIPSERRGLPPHMTRDGDLFDGDVGLELPEWRRSLKAAVRELAV
jgi:dTDP-4-dehydrorhamnose reductase